MKTLNCTYWFSFNSNFTFEQERYADIDNNLIS